MDISEASWSANRSVPIHWVDIYCADDYTIASDVDIEQNIQQSNAILMRSGASFKIHISTRKSIFQDNCDIEPFHVDRHLDVRKSVAQFMKERDGFVVIAAIVTTAGGFARSRDLAYIDKRALGQPQKTLLHELGHVWTLIHPFEMKQSFPDLPKGCATSATRSNQLWFCPNSLRTCSDSTEDELLDNVMDYLPEYCGKKYRFSRSQIDIIERESRFSILPLN